jgi:hypothetical protein
MPVSPTVLTGAAADSMQYGIPGLQEKELHLLPSNLDNQKLRKRVRESLKQYLMSSHSQEPETSVTGKAPATDQVNSDTEDTITEKAVEKAKAKQAPIRELCDVVCPCAKLTNNLNSLGVSTPVLETSEEEEDKQPVPPFKGRFHSIVHNPG